MIYKMANNSTLLCIKLNSSEFGGYIILCDFHTALLQQNLQGKWWYAIL